VLSRTSWGRGALVATFVLVCSQAGATVTQVDGTIIPLTTRLQGYLDTSEASMAGDPLRLDAVQDAAELPQLFVPRVSSPVAFGDIAEGAGYENTFGWYNIGDDVSTVTGRDTNLHPIFGCGTPMNATGDAKTHKGNTSYYVVDAEPGAAITVDFAQEKLDGRYKGGFIGFYLITPEGNAGGNCGDSKQTSGGTSKFGHIYFTQKDLNNDGDFVHHLVYSSKKAANRYFLGFEDLFRGGDNDFEDMLIRSDGLSAPCIPHAEICDGIDNDCDGLVDAADPSLVGVNDVCTCDGTPSAAGATDGLKCDNGPQKGVCAPGTTKCVAAAIVCHGTPGNATAETCNLKDDNCNGLVDDGALPGTGVACDGTDADLCKNGATVCQNGSIVCNGDMNIVEQCNAIDDNCNGTNNEGDPGGGGQCGTSNIGRCKFGVNHCVGNAIVCQGSVGPIAEICNGIDDDCDGVIDETPTDVGAQCGATNVGACDFGMTICVSGTLQCGGAIGPSPETCNGVDDDCNGVVDNSPVDAGQACGTSIGECDPGMYQCQMGMLKCVGGTGPQPETCDNKDNDCNGIVDDGTLPGVGAACGTGTGPCSGGTDQCINGSIQCVGGTSTGTETCNNIDDDCDGTVDEGDLCGGGTCDHGVCASPCVAGEFPCPGGKRCVNTFCVDDPCYNVQCPADGDGNLQTCAEGQCVALCPTISCNAGTVCRGTDGSCVPDTCAYLPKKCSASELCVNDQCVPNKCLGVTCGDGQFCRDGDCIGSCLGVNCGTAQTCVDGTCKATGCDRDCTDKEVCNPDTKKCEQNLCADGTLHCPPTEACDPLTGTCVEDVCNGIVCPDNQVCTDGQCGVGKSGALVTTGGGGGCDASGNSGAGSLALIGLALGALLLRRRGIALAKTGPLLAVALASTLTACDVNKYCINCENGGTGDGGMGGDGGTGDDGGSGDGGLSCDPFDIHPETCNHADDDCDGLIDETIDFMNDARNCGACNVECNKPGAQTKCEQGACVVTGCFPGFEDVDMDTSTYSTSNGCEYMCFTSNGAVEACDGLDNDCDGKFDEGFATDDDVNNCGRCKQKCDFFQASPTCDMGMCSFDPATDCTPGFIDADGMQGDGCEYQCTNTNGGVEKCDVIDNDCDGKVDETFVLATDKNNCGRCGNVCAFPHTVPKCSAGTCGFNSATDCVPGFFDIDGMQANGCEYSCTKTNGGVEKCDGVDNNCDGIADNGTMAGVGVACSAVTPAKGACIANGTTTCSAGAIVCSGATQPTLETCNGVDQDCDGVADGAENITQSCYTGAAGTQGVGLCKAGSQLCTGTIFGGCTGQVTPTTEACDGNDNDCDSRVDEGLNAVACYDGPGGTSGVGICHGGTAACSNGALGACVGEQIPKTEICGDGLNSDCDANDDAAEGCQDLGAEIRIDEIPAASVHSYDVQLQRGFGGNVYVVFAEGVDIWLKRSTDGGLTFQSRLNITTGIDDNAVKPLVAVAAGATAITDRVVISFQTVNGGVRDIRAWTSADSGANFTQGTAGGSATLDASNDSFHHAIAISGNTVVLAWESLDTSTLNRDVRTRTSTDGGATWGTENIVNTSGQGPTPATTRFAGRPTVGITTAGKIVWAWREQRSGATRDMFAASAASAATAPGGEVRIDGDATDKRDADFPKLVTNEESVYLVWQDVSTLPATDPAGGSDVMFARSLDGGAAWGGEVIIDDPAGELSSSFTPAIAVDPRTAGVADDVVAIAWEDRREGTQAYTKFSLNGATSFNAVVRASNLAGDAQPGETTVPQIAAQGSGRFTVVYQNKLTDTAKSHVFATGSIDNGATWTYTAEQADTGTGAAEAPAVCATQVLVGTVTKLAAMVAWTDFRGNVTNGDIYIAVAK
jgi:uncharacterized protein (TIGR03382 family)